MKMINAVYVALFVAATTFACSSSEKTDSTSGSSGTPAPTGTAGSSGASGSSGTSGAPGSSGTSGTTAEAPKAPTLDQVAKMMGSLHVMWTNPEAASDTVEVERKATMPDGAEMEAYKVVFSVPGEVDNKMDSTATDDMKYTYRLRAKKGDKYSAYSNEVSGNPKK